MSESNGLCELPELNWPKETQYLPCEHPADHCWKQIAGQERLWLDLTRLFVLAM